MPSKSDKPEKSYKVLSLELDQILLELQGEDLDIEIALEKYERGLAIISRLEKVLNKAENRITELKATFDNLKAE